MFLVTIIKACVLYKVWGFFMRFSLKIVLVSILLLLLSFSLVGFMANKKITHVEPSSLPSDKNEQKELISSSQWEERDGNFVYKHHSETYIVK